MTINALRFVILLLVGAGFCGCRSASESREIPPESGVIDPGSLPKTQLASARLAWDLDSTESRGIWVGRRLAYLGRHEEAIAWYRKLLNRWPDSYRIRRHLGHRLISMREFDTAVAVLSEASRLARPHPNRIEADGAPNALDTPRSSTHGNIDYHLALAHYLRGDFDLAAKHWRLCVEQWALTDDSKVAALHWLHLSLQRAGKKREAEESLSLMPADPDVIENHAYADLVRLYRGEVSVDDLVSKGSGASRASLAYGLARWHLRQGDRAEGLRLLTSLAAEPVGNAFGEIAAEADVKRGALSLSP